MSHRILRTATCCLLLLASAPDIAHAQVALPSASPSTAQPGQGFNTEQLDALVAPIALYPDALLTQLLMASTFPLQIVQASRWAEDPAHKELSGEALVNALDAELWDPSVKSIVAFPQVLSMMNGNLDWTQQLGYAFADQQAAVMDSVQRLRRQAQASGSLQTTAQLVVHVEERTVIIEPAQPDTVYVPSYDPAVVYGSWPYPSYPPVAVAPAPAYGYPLASGLAAGLAFGAGVAITAGLWNWASPRWNSGSVDVNVNRYNNINKGGARITNSTWQANRGAGRPAGLQRPPTGPVGLPARQAGLPASAIGRQQVSVPRNAVAPPSRAAGAPNRTAGAGTGRQSLASAGAGSASSARQGGGAVGGSGGGLGGRTNASQFGGSRPAPSAPRQQQGAFGGMNQGRQASQCSQRGSQSRSFAQSQPRAASGGGRRR